MTKNNISVLCALLCAAPILHADDGDDLQHNPFSRPTVAAATPAVSAALESATIEGLVLIATMTSSKGGLANVDGRIVKAGDTIGDITLLQVYEDRAVFRHNDRTVTVFVKPPVESDE